MPCNVAVAASQPDPILESTAAALARRLRLPLASPNEAGAAPGIDLRIVVTPRRLELRDLREPGSRPLYVDFVGAPGDLQRMLAGGRKQPLARAVGIRGDPPTVLDVTAGLCRDAFHLAALGCNVTAIERSPIVAALVEDALLRARRAESAKLNAILSRLEFVHHDAARWLNEISPGSPSAVKMPPDVIYLDPMYPPSTKSAEVRREMRTLRELVGDDPDSAELFDRAMAVAKRRVVVKRLRHSPRLGPEPSHSIHGTRIRYDVYLRPLSLLGLRSDVAERGLG